MASMLRVAAMLAGFAFVVDVGNGAQREEREDEREAAEDEAEEVNHGSDPLNQDVDTFTAVHDVRAVHLNVNATPAPLIPGFAPIKGLMPHSHALCAKRAVGAPAMLQESDFFSVGHRGYFPSLSSRAHSRARAWVAQV